jgi:hypothetical protein
VTHILRSALVLLAASALAPGLSHGAEILKYDARVAVEPDGTGRGTATLLVSGTPGENVDVPLPPSFTAVKAGETSEGVKVEIKAKALRVTLPPAPAASPAPAAPPAEAPKAPAPDAAKAAAKPAEPPAHRVAFTFDVPEAFTKVEPPAKGEKLTLPRDSRTVKFSFVNTQAAAIKSFGVLYVLPADMRVQAIREQLPKLKKSEVEPRVRLGAADGRQNAFLQMPGLKQGDAASMQLEAIPSSRSPLWLVAGLALSALYLVKFRDLVSGSRPTESR